MINRDASEVLLAAQEEKHARTPPQDLTWTQWIDLRPLAFLYCLPSGAATNFSGNRFPMRGTGAPAEAINTLASA